MMGNEYAEAWQLLLGIDRICTSRRRHALGCRGLIVRTTQGIGNCTGSSNAEATDKSARSGMQCKRKGNRCTDNASAYTNHCGNCFQKTWFLFVF